MSVTKSFKGRKLDISRPVQVYRNLNGGRDRVWSIRQDGLVKAHADELYLWDARFHVGEGGVRRALATRRRNVHAWATGMLQREAPPWSIFFGAPQVRYSLAFGFVLGRDTYRQVKAADWLNFQPDGRVRASGLGLR